MFDLMLDWINQLILDLMLVLMIVLLLRVGADSITTQWCIWWLLLSVMLVSIVSSGGWDYPTIV